MAQPADPQPQPQDVLDVLAFGAHPDDVEIGCGGTLARLSAAGARVGIADLTRGEMGTRGTPETRAQEAAQAALELGLHVREQLGLPDGFLAPTPEAKAQVAAVIRRWRPRVVLAPAPQDRHPDHGNGHQLVTEAAFLAGLRAWQTTWQGQPQEPWRPQQVYSYIQDRYLPPHLVVDVTDHFGQKQAALKAYGTQFFNPTAGETEGSGPQTWISSERYWHFLEARARQMGHHIGVTFGEGFVAPGPLAVDPLNWRHS